MAPLLLWPFLLLLSSPSVLAQQNITLGSWLAPQGPNSSWLSPSGDFAFGFRPVEGNSSSYFIAVWFNKIGDKTVAWYAKSNEEPVQVTSGSRLQITPDGTLSLHDSTSREVWNPQVAGIAYATMLDTGNFILAAADGSTRWESFKNPTDTILLTQVLTPNMILRSRLLATDYSDGRFQLNMQTDGVALYYVAVPSGNQYDSYWSSAGNTTKLVFDATGRIYIALGNGTQINMTSTVIGPMADFYHRATLDYDGVFRQYVYPKKVSNVWSQSWNSVGFQPPNICDAQTKVGSGTCGFNSYCSFDGARNETNCMCPTQYSFIDEERKYKGCKPDFQPQSCDLDDTAAMMQFQLTPLKDVDWPQADYEQYTSISEDNCRRLCLIDCFCAVTVFHENQCWKKKLPLSNGNMGSGVQRKVLIKVPKNNSAQSALGGSSKWKKDKKNWILGSSLLLGGSFLVNILLISVILFGTYCTVTRKKLPPKNSSGNHGLPLKAFTYAELEKATDGFKEVLGTGASGIVYKGQLQDELDENLSIHHSYTCMQGSLPTPTKKLEVQVVGGSAGTARDIEEKPTPTKSEVVGGSAGTARDIEEKPTPTKSEVVGGRAGTARDIKEKPWRLESLTISYLSLGLVDAFSFTYIDQTGKKQTAGPWGEGNIYGKTETILFGPSEFLEEVSGTHGIHFGNVLVMSLAFVTNVKIYGPFGNPYHQNVPATPFRFIADEDSSIVGFHGSSGTHLYSIGVYTLQCPSKSSSVRPLPAPGQSLPTPTKIGAEGGTAGIARDIKETPWRLESLTIGYLGLVDAFSFSYTDQARKKQTVGPWGEGYHYDKTEMIRFGPTEFLVEVSGTYGTHFDNVLVMSLTFVTNIRSYGPFGNPRHQGVPATPFRFRADKNSSIVGFHGRSGQHLYSIGVYTAAL